MRKSLNQSRYQIYDCLKTGPQSESTAFCRKMAIGVLEGNKELLWVPFLRLVIHRCLESL